MIQLTQEDLTVDGTALGAGMPGVCGRARELFQSAGCFLARGLISRTDLDVIRTSVAQFIELRLRALGVVPTGQTEGTEFDSGLGPLMERDQGERDVVVSALSRSLALQRVGLSEQFAQVSKLLMDTDLIMASAINNLQMQLPGEEARLLPWHQDYPYVQDSEDGVVYWAPLRDLAGGNSALRVALGSHRLGVLRLRPAGRGWKIADLSALDPFPQAVIAAQTGDVLVFSTLLLHASVPNRDSRARWTLQVRHGNFRHPLGVTRSWPGCRPYQTTFDQTHPEYCIKDGA